MPTYSESGSTWTWGDGNRLTALPGQYRVVQKEVVVPEVGNLKPTPPEFMLLLTLQERAAIRAAAPNDPVVNDLLLMLNDPRLTFVDLTNVSVQEAVQYMTTTKTPLLTADRVKRILVGLPPQATYQ